LALALDLLLIRQVDGRCDDLSLADVHQVHRKQDVSLLSFLAPHYDFHAVDEPAALQQLEDDFSLFRVGPELQLGYRLADDLLAVVSDEVAEGRIGVEDLLVLERNQANPDRRELEQRRKTRCRAGGDFLRLAGFLVFDRRRHRVGPDRAFGLHGNFRSDFRALWLMIFGGATWAPTA